MHGPTDNKSKTSTFISKSFQPLFNSNKIQPKTAREENRYPIFVASELRDCSKMLEKADMKNYWFWRLCVLYNWVKINTFSCRPFLRRRLLVTTKITNIDDLILRLRLFTHPGKFLFIYLYKKKYLTSPPAMIYL